MNHLELSKELNTFSFEYNQMTTNPFSITNETQKRVILSRLYYALFHRILEELPNLASSTAPNMHSNMETILIKQSSNGEFYSRLLELFKDLKKFRVWADYTTTNQIPCNGNFIVLLKKVHGYIEAKRVIY